MGPAGETDPEARSGARGVRGVDVQSLDKGEREGQMRSDRWVGLGASVGGVATPGVGRCRHLGQ